MRMADRMSRTGGSAPSVSSPRDVSSGRSARRAPARRRPATRPIVRRTPCRSRSPPMERPAKTRDAPTRAQRVPVVQEQPEPVSRSSSATVPALRRAQRATNGSSAPRSRAGSVGVRSSRSSSSTSSERVLRDLAEARSEVPVRQARQRGHIAQHRHRLVEGAHEVLALGRLTAVLPPIAASTWPINVVGTCTNRMPRMWSMRRSLRDRRPCRPRGRPDIVRCASWLAS